MKDYGQRRNGPARQARQRAALPGWVWLATGMCIGTGIAAFFYIARPAAPAAAQAQLPAAAEPKAAAKPPPKKIELPPKEKARFSFYELLPSHEVMIPREAGKPAAPIAEPGEYIIQVGSFRAARDAENQRAALALLGIEARIEKVTIDNQATWYRVRIGPERDLARVHTTLARLQENEIESFLVRVKQ